MQPHDLLPLLLQLLRLPPTLHTREGLLQHLPFPSILLPFQPGFQLSNLIIAVAIKEGIIPLHLLVIHAPHRGLEARIPRLAAGEVDDGAFAGDGFFGGEFGGGVLGGAGEVAVVLFAGAAFEGFGGGGVGGAGGMVGGGGEGFGRLVFGGVGAAAGSSSSFAEGGLGFYQGTEGDGCEVVVGGSFCSL